MCSPCLRRFVARLRLLEKEYASTHPQEYENQQIENLTSRVRSAERILGTARPMDSEEKRSHAAWECFAKQRTKERAEPFRVAIGQKPESMREIGS
jgi:hypothetical protein